MKPPPVETIETLRADIEAWRYRVKTLRCHNMALKEKLKEVQPGLEFLLAKIVFLEDKLKGLGDK